MRAVWRKTTERIHSEIIRGLNAGCSDQEISETMLGQAASIAIQNNVTRELFLDLAGKWFDQMAEFQKTMTHGE